MTKRCGWVNEKNELYIKYHDEEWGEPIYDDTKLFELLCLEGAQAGLTWENILNRRMSYRKLFYNFNPDKVSKITNDELEIILEDKSIIRNRKKIFSVVNNAKCFIAIQKEYGSFCSYIWGLVDNLPIRNNWKSLDDVPTDTTLSLKLSKDLKKKGFSFVGPKICYAYMQAMGLVNDHVQSCFKYYCDDKR